MAETLPPLDALTSDDRFKALPLEEKNSVLNGYFSEAEKVDPAAGQARNLVMRVTGLEHIADRETPDVQAKLRADIPAYVDAYQNALSGADPQEVVKGLTETLKTNENQFQQSRRQRDVNLALADEYQSLGGVTNLQNRAVDFLTSFDTNDPANDPIGVRKAEIEQTLKMTPEQIAGLSAESKVLKGQADTPAGVDSQGNVFPNLTKLITDKEGVRKYISDLPGVAENAKNRALGQLDSQYENVLNETATRLADLPVSPDLMAKGTVFGDSQSLTEVIADRARKIQDERPTQRGQAISDEAITRARGEVLKELSQNEAGRNVLSRGLTEAGLDLRGIGQAADLALRKSGIDIELPGVTAGSTSELDATRAAIGQGRELDNPGVVESFGEGLIRLLPQILITRGIGSGVGIAAGTSARAFGAELAAANTIANRAASAAAIGYGGLQTAAGAVEQVRQNGGTEEQQLEAGALGFLTTVGVTAGFEKLHLGGVEDFTKKVAASKGELTKALSLAGLGEAGEEFSDEILNAFTSGAIANPDADIRDVAKQAFEAGLYGGIFGVGSHLGSTRIEPRNAPTIDQSTPELEARADAILETNKLLGNITEGEQRVAEINAVAAPEIPTTNSVDTGNSQVDNTNAPANDTGTTSIPSNPERPGVVDSNSSPTNIGNTGTDQGNPDTNVGSSGPTGQADAGTGVLNVEENIGTNPLPPVTDGQQPPTNSIDEVVQLREQPPVTPVDNSNANPEPTGPAPDAAAQEEIPVAEPVKQRGVKTEAPVRALTKAEETRARAIVDTVTEGADINTKDSALAQVREALANDPEAGNGFLFTAARRGASRRGNISEAEKAAREAGSVSSLQAGENATLEESVASIEATPDVVASREDLSRNLETAISKLSERDQAIMRGTLEGKSDSQLATELGASANAIAAAKKRAQEKLRKDPTLNQIAAEEGYKSREAAVTAEGDQVLLDRLKGSLVGRSPSPAVRQKAQAFASKLRVSTKSTPGITAAKKVAAFLNVRPVFVDGLGNTNGAFDSKSPGVVYISSATSRPEFMVTIHEALHSFAQNDPSAYERLKTEVAPDIEAYRKTQPRYSGKSDPAVTEEFLADFMADRLTDKDFVQSLAEKSPSTFQKFANLLRSLIKNLIDGRQGTEAFVRDLKRADAALRDALLQIRLSGQPTAKESDGGVKFEKQSRTQGTRNDESTYSETSLKEAQAVIAKNYFDPETVPLDDAGIKTATDFLVNLLDEKFMRGIQQRLLDTTSINSANRATVALGLTRASYFGYVARLNQVDKAKAAVLLKQGYRLANDIKAYFEEGVSASELGLALRSLGGDGSGGIAALFAVEFKGRQDNVDGKFGPEVGRVVKTAENARPDVIREGDNISEAQREKNEALETAIEDAKLSLDPEALKYIKEAEQGARNAWKKVLAVFEALTSDTVKFETAFDRFKNLVNNPDSDLSQFNAAFDAAFDEKKNSFSPEQRSALETALAQSSEASRRRESRTGTSRTSNPVDILGKRLIGVVKRYTQSNKTKENDAKPGFDALIAKEGLSRAEFTDQYVGLGGTAEIANEVFDANQSRQARAADVAVGRENVRQIRSGERQSQAQAKAAKRAREAESREKTAREEARTRMEKFIAGLASPARDGKRPTDQNDTIQGAFNRFTRLQTASVDTEVFEQQLREFIDSKGNPALTEDEVQQISAIASTVRKEAVQARAAKLEETYNRRTAEADKRAAEAESAAEARIQKTVDALGGSSASGKRPTAENDTFQKAFQRFVNLNNASLDPSVFEQQLREFVREDGKPVLTENQVQEISAKAVIARQEALTLRSEKLEADRAKAVEQDRRREITNFEKKFEAPQRKDAGKRTLDQIIRDEFINSPTRRIQTEAEQIAFAEEILTEMTDLSPDEVKKFARNISKDITAKTEEAIFKALQPFLKSLQKGGLTSDQISKAIRLQALDPSKDFLTSVAALSGWEGLKVSESAELLELERRINLLGRTSPNARVYLDRQARIIQSATGLSPSTKEVLNTYLAGSMFSAIGSQLVGFNAMAYQVASLGTRERFSALLRNKGDLAATFREIREFKKGSRRALLAGINAYRQAIKTGVNPIEQLRATQEEQQGSIYIDPLTRKYDLETRKFEQMLGKIAADPKSVSAVQWKKFQYQFTKYVVTSQRFSLRSLSAIDSFAVTYLAETKANVLRYRAAVDSGITPERYDAVVTESYKIEEATRSFLMKEVGLTDERQIQLEVFNRVNGAMVQGFMDLGVDTSNFRAESIADVKARIGTGETSQETPVGKVTEGVIKAINSVPVIPLSGLLPAVRTGGNLIDERIWDTPGLNIVRLLKAKNLSTAELASRFPNIRADWQLRERKMRVYASNTLALGLGSLLYANKDLPDDEKWFWFVGGYPLDQAGKNEFNRKKEQYGWDTNMLILGPLRIPLTRGVAETLLMPLVISKTFLDAFDEKGFEGKDAAMVAENFFQLLVPGYGQLSSIVNRKETGTQLQNLATGEALKFIPFSGALKSPRKVFGDSVDRKTSEVMWNLVDPFYTTSDAEGIVQMKSMLGETLQEDANPGSIAGRSGFPFSFTWKESDANRDPVKKKIGDDFVQLGYSGGRFESTNFKKKLEKEGVKYTPNLWKRFNEARIKEFQKNYIPAREKVLKSKDPGAAIGAIWSKATPEAYESIGIKSN